MNNENCLNIFVIAKDNSLKGIFDVVMMFVSIYNIFGNAYYAAFGIPTDKVFQYADQTVESLYLLDMIFCFI